MIELKPYQLKPIEFLKNNRGLILYHSTGSGKTLTALFAMYQFPNDIIIVGTKSSRKTFTDNILKAEMNPSRFTFYTYAKIKKLLETDIKIFRNRSVIIDEAHNIRNENIHNIYISSALMLASKVLLLTATPVINHLNDLSVLVNIIKGADVLPTDPKLFDQLYYDDEKMILVNKHLLFEKIKNTLSYYKVVNDENYPTTSVHYIEVEMNHDQINEYVFYIRKIIYEGDDTVSNIDVLNLDYALLPSKKKNFFLNVTRQISNTVNNSDNSPKIRDIYNKIIQGPFPAIVYSNFLRNGIYTLASLLEKNNISYKSITGNITHDKLNMIVNNYNDGMYKILLISSAGSESLDLKNTRQIHIMEPHWNDSKIVQVIGRAIRYKSHSDLPVNERHVDIYYWISIFPEHIKNISADQYLMEISKRKKDLWQTYHEIIVAASIENNYFKDDSENSGIRENSAINLNDASQKKFYDKYIKYKKKYLTLKNWKKIEKNWKKIEKNWKKIEKN